MLHSSTCKPLASIYFGLNPVHLTLLVPELIWPEPADQFTLGKLDAPGLLWLLARARPDRQPRAPFENVLAGQFSAEPAPLAALRLLGEGQAAAQHGHWLCADPVHLRFHHERIVLADAGAFELELDEAQAMVEALNQTFADIGEFRVSDTRRWYLRLHVAVDHPVEPISAVAGRRIDGELKDNPLPLTRWLNEVQMFLHGHPVNERRQAAGKPAINSLWLWGGGELHSTFPARADEAASSGDRKTGDRPRFPGQSGENRGLSPISPTAVFSDNPLAAGLALAAGLPLHARPATLAAGLAEAGERPLVVLDQLLPRVLYEEGEGWRRAFEALENDWFAPLRKALGKQVDRISLITTTVYGELHYTIEAGERWKFWKSSPPLQAIAENLAGKKSA